MIWQSLGPATFRRIDLCFHTINPHSQVPTGVADPPRMKQHDRHPEAPARACARASKDGQGTCLGHPSRLGPKRGEHLRVTRIAIVAYEVPALHQGVYARLRRAMARASKDG